jgi:hypothetical protein
MKRHFFLLGIVLAVTASEAPAQENNWMLNASGSYDNKHYTSSMPNYYGKPADLNLKGWSLHAGVGKTIGFHIMVGLEGGGGKQDGVWQASNSYGTMYSQDKYHTSNWNASVFGRYTSDVSRRIFAYAQLYVTKFENDYIRDPSLVQNTALPYYYVSPTMPAGNGIEVGLKGVAGVNIIRGYGLYVDVGGLNYTSYNSAVRGSLASDLKEFNFTLGQHFSFGIHKVLGWKKMNNVAPVTK